MNKLQTHAWEIVTIAKRLEKITQPELFVERDGLNWETLNDVMQLQLDLRHALLNIIVTGKNKPGRLELET